MVGSTTSIGLNGKADEATYWRHGSDEIRGQEVSVTITMRLVFGSRADAEEKHKRKGTLPDFNSAPNREWIVAISANNHNHHQLPRLHCNRG
jgi:hypothetical protein